MEFTPRSPEERYGPALEKAQSEMKGRSPRVIAGWADVQFAGTEDAGQFDVRFWDTMYTVSYPDGIVLDTDGNDPPIGTKIVLLHYLLTANGTPMADRWVSFREFPGGLGYDAAFQARANRRLAATFGERVPAFEEAARSLGGMSLDVGDSAFIFDVLPRVRVAVVIYAADEEFSASANVIFDGAASSYLPTEDIAILGDIIASRLSKFKSS